MLSQVIGDLLPSALGVAISPIPIIAVILMLATPRARSNGPAFAAGWILALIIVSTIVLLAAGGADNPDSSSSTTADIARVAFGLFFFVLALKQWKSRPKPGEAVSMPAWMSTIDTFGVGKSFGLGALLAGVNPKNLALTLAAAATIAQAGLSTGQSTVAVGFFVVIASLTVAGPVLYYVVAGDRAAKPLVSIKEFMGAHMAAIMTVLFIILGGKLLGAGYAGLTN